MKEKALQTSTRSKRLHLVRTSFAPRAFHKQTHRKARLEPAISRCAEHLSALKAVPRCPVPTSALFSLLASVLTLEYHFLDRNITRNASKQHLQDVYFVFTLYYFLNVTNYKVVTGLAVTSGSKFLLVHPEAFCTSPGLVDYH